LAFVAINIIVVGMKMISFSDDMLPFLKKYKDIHFWENLVTGGYTLFLILMGYNILFIICSVYPALILHKGLINLGSKLSFFAEATDDPTGKTYSIPILNIKIKRSNTHFRLIAAAMSLFTLLVIEVFKWNISLHLI